VRRPLWGIVWTLAAAACSRQTSGSGNGGASTPVSGTVAGRSFSAGDAAGFFETNGNETDVVVTTWNGACSAFMERTSPANSAVLSIGLSGASHRAVGTYYITVNGPVQVGYEAQDANCNPTVQEIAWSGTVTYEAIDSSAIVGVVDAVFAGAGHLRGRFTASVCKMTLAALTAGSGEPMTCQH
jgi:hypothetical protein